MAGNYPGSIEKGWYRCNTPDCTKTKKNLNYCPAKVVLEREVVLPPATATHIQTW
jgi:hypothetical protein